MLWVFLACALECVAAAGAYDGADACCEPVAGECSAPEMGGAEAHSCLLVPVDPVVLGSGGAMPTREAAPAGLPALAGDRAVVGQAPDVQPRSAGPPPRGRPLDRLPVLLI